MKDLYSLPDLERNSGYKARTIRSYIEKGLLPSPSSYGRTASYGREHLLRLLALRALREDQGMTLEEARRELLSLSPSDLEKLAEEALRTPLFGSEPASEKFVKDFAQVQGCMVVDTDDDMCLEDFDEDDISEPESRPNHGWRTSRQPDETPLARALHLLEEVQGPVQHRPARSDIVQRIEVTPDIHLEVKGELPSGQVKLLERIADHLREALTGGPA